MADTDSRDTTDPVAFLNKAGAGKTFLKYIPGAEIYAQGDATASLYSFSAAT